MCEVQLGIDLQLWFRSVSWKDIMPLGETGVHHQLHWCFKAILNGGDAQNVVRQHFTNISDPHLALRESRWVGVSKHKQDLGREFPLSVSRIQVSSSFRCLQKELQLFIKATNSLKIAMLFFAI